MLTHPALDGDTQRLLRVERTVFRVRWGAALLGVILILTYRGEMAAGYIALAAASVGFLVIANLLITRILARTATRERVRHASMWSAVVDFVCLQLFMFAFLFDINNSVRSLFFIVPFIGAIRFQLRGALLVTALASPVYVLHQWYGAEVFGHELIVPSMLFRVGVGFMIAYTAGNMSSTLTRESREAEEKNVALAEVNTAITGFVTVASHEMRTPLAVAKGVTQLLEQPEGTLSEEQRTATLASMGRQIDRLELLVDGLLRDSHAQASDPQAVTGRQVVVQLTETAARPGTETR